MATDTRADPDARLPPGTVKPKRLRPRFHYELLACGTAGHELVGTDVADLAGADPLLVRDHGEERWYRCLRCDSWVVLGPPAHPARERMPPREEIELPLRGKPLRDKIVLRVIAVDRALHFVVLVLLAVAVFAIANDQASLRATFYRVVTDLQTSLGGTAHATRGGFVGRIEELLGQRQGALKAAAAVLAAYGLLEGVEAVGLWLQKRWAEYLTFLATALLLPLEVYELTQKLSPFKIVALIVNIAVVIYLLFAKRLFGLRGGARAEEELRERDMGWTALERTRPQAT
jgi:uncharacterized membrane protein (DUF2068 family)